MATKTTKKSKKSTTKKSNVQKRNKSTSAKASKTTKKTQSKRPQQSQKRVKTTRVRGSDSGFSTWQLVLLSALSFLAAYIFASRAIDSGSLWDYAFSIGTTYLGVKFAGYAINTLLKSGSKTSKK